MYLSGQIPLDPATGQMVEFQIFAPLAAGQAGFACSLEFTEVPDAFNREFKVLSVKDWNDTELFPVPGSGGLLRTVSRMSFSDIPPSGHILTVQLAPTGARPDPAPLKLQCSVSVASIPPRRLMRAVGVTQIIWR